MLHILIIKLSHHELKKKTIDTLKDFNYDQQFNALKESKNTKV